MEEENRAILLRRAEPALTCGGWCQTTTMLDDDAQYASISVPFPGPMTTIHWTW